ncbi:hypothetical protein [Streptomyces sp. NPDC005209]|uniref:hypothetical protein n=1 Tax=Streptomyces sp. NPDC005209 TaxID=3156715 RepID=UPI0033BBBB03
MKFEFSVDENEAHPPSGFDLGHMDVRGDAGEASSRNRTPDRAMMIYLSLTLLLDGLRRFLEGRDRVHATSAVDSSFSLSFRRRRDGSVETVHEDAVVDRSSAKELATAVHAGAEEFASSHLPLLSADDAGRQDLETSLAAFGALLARLT